MYFKLAIRNVKKSYKDYLIYFLTLAFSVCLFYTFNSFQDQQSVMSMNASQVEIAQVLSDVMNYLSIFVAIVLAFLILYANNFLIKRRKKELGIYTLLGMPKGKISRVLIYETFLIGLFSLFIGIIIGLFLSQILTSLTANLFDVELNYSFVFSKGATILTIISFSIIFFIIMLFNAIVLNRYKLIDLLHAEQMIEKMRIKKIWISILLFILAIAFLGYAYYAALSNGIEALNNLLPIILCGCIGTVLFFMSLSGFLLTLIKSRKSLYLKNLNCFVLKQINANVNSNFISMSIVSIMLLLSIGALSTGMNLNATINSTIQNSTPYDYSLAIQYTYPNGSEIWNQSFDFKKTINSLSVDRSNIANQSYTSIYYSPIKATYPGIFNSIKDESMKKFISANSSMPTLVIKQSDYNKTMREIDGEEVHLKDNETHLFSTMATIESAINDILRAHPNVKLFDNELKVVNDTYESPSMYTTKALGYELLYFVVPDQQVPIDTKKYLTAWNVNFKDELKATNFSENIETQFYKAINSQDNYFISSADRLTVKGNSMGLSVIFTYVGLYLGIVFMIASAVILALQLLSQASDNKKHYVILSKIGAEKKMMDRSILLQISIYFLMPLALGIIHSIVGIQVVNNVVTLFGKGDIFFSSLTTAGIIILIYGAYFITTYFGYKNILQS